LFYCVHPRFYQKILQNYGFSFKKNWDIWNPKFQQNFIVYYLFFIFSAFLAFCFLFHLSKLVQKLWNFLKCFIGRVRDFINDFWKIVKVLLKKNINMWNIFFFKILRFTICFIIILFSILPICSWQKILEIFMFFILWIRYFIKEFWKIMEYFSKKYRHLKSKILHKFHRLLFVFFLLFF